MRDKRTPKDVCGEAISSATEDRLWLTLKVEIYAPVSVVNEALETIVLF